MGSHGHAYYLNGEEATLDAMHVGVFGPLALWGEGTFDTFRVSAGRILFCEPHQRRLSTACRDLWGPQPVLESLLRETWATLTRDAGGYEHARGRVLVAPRDAERERFDVFAELAPTVPLRTSVYEQGLRAGYSTYAHPGLGLWGKNTSALWSRMAADEAKRRKLDEVILCRDGIVVEAGWSAVIWSEDGSWRTPAPSLGGMPSTTLSALRAQGLEVDNVVATRERLSYADAVVLLSAVRLAIGLSSLEGRQFTDPDRAARPLRELLLSA